jgi:hypothetical protein
MSDALVRPEALDYLAGLSLHADSLPPKATWLPIPLAARRLEDVHGVGFNDRPADRQQAPPPFATESLLAGLAGESIPFVFQVDGGPGGVRFSVGTWGAENGAGLRQQHDVLTSLVDGAYLSVSRATRPVDVPAYASLTLGGLAHGVPSGVISDGEAPWDRLLRGLPGANFSVLILAEPIDAATLLQLRDVALEDLRAALSVSDPRGTAPLTKAYERQVEALVESLDRGLSTGAWRTAVYLLGDTASYWRLAAAWRGLFSSSKPPMTSLRVLPSPSAAGLAAGWTLPYQPAPAGPRIWRHPFLNQSLLNTLQLASIAHFPQRETPGFAVRPAPLFPVSRPAVGTKARQVEIGEIYAQQRGTATAYRLDLDSLTRHAFVTGLTGSGKTNTVMHLLMQAAAADVPFLVIEPAKTEYRELLGQRGLADTLRVFTLGREQVAPLRINPFEVPDGIDVATHLDLLKAVFMGSFALWIPLPQILEQCLIDLYTEHGWDFTTGQHRGGDADAAPRVPTIGELVIAVERTVPTLGYKGESTQELTAALTTALNGLRRGARGLMLDVEQSIPMSELLKGPTIIELEGIGDDGDKAFIMGLLLVRLYEHRRAENSARLAAAAAAGLPAPPGNPLKHLVVIEEAHRLLSGGKKLEDSWHADPQGAFSDAFSQMLSEVRAYGQGIIISDQVPVRLAPDVLKNTNLKIGHRLVSGDDRLAMAEAMSMSDEQSRILPTLPRGRAAVFSEGDFAPLIVGIPKAKDLGTGVAIDDAKVAQAMRQWRGEPRIARYFEDNAFCAGVCRSPSACRGLRALAQSADGRLLGMRLFTTLLADGDGLDVVWPDVAAFVSARAGAGEDVPHRVQAFALHLLHVVVSRRATQGRWPTTGVANLVAALRAVIAESAHAASPWLGATAPRLAAMDAAQALMRRTHDPYPLCASLCTDGLCRYRDPLVDILSMPKHTIFSADAGAQPEPMAYVIEVAGYAAGDVVALSDAAPGGGARLVAARWSALGCAAQSKFGSGDRPGEASALVAAALASVNWPGARAAVDPSSTH